MRSLSLLLLLSLASTCEAAAVFRCEDASGHVSFTQLGCPAGQAGETVVADNPPPGGRSVTPRAETKTKKASIGRKSVPLAVIGEEKIAAADAWTRRNAARRSWSSGSWRE